MSTANTLADLPKYTREAVRFYWQTRAQQVEKQRKAGGSDQGSRSAVTGGAQMNGFRRLVLPFARGLATCFSLKIARHPQNRSA